MVTVSSTTRQRAPASTGPSIQRWSPCCLRSLRTKKPDQSLAARHRDRRAGKRDRRHHRAPDRGGAELARRRGEQLARGAEARRAQERTAGVDVVGGALAARQRHLADHQSVLAKLVQERGARLIEVAHRWS